MLIFSVASQPENQLSFVMIKVTCLGSARHTFSILNAIPHASRPLFTLCLPKGPIHQQRGSEWPTCVSLAPPPPPPLPSFIALSLSFTPLHSSSNPLLGCQLVNVSENLSSLSSEWPTIKMMSELGVLKAYPSASASEFGAVAGKLGTLCHYHHDRRKEFPHFRSQMNSPLKKGVLRTAH